MAKKDTKVIPNKVAPEVLRALADVVGEEWVTEDRAVIETYSRFSVDAAGTLKKHHRDHTALPACIVLPGSTEEVQAIMRIATRFKVQVIPFTNGMISFNGPTNPLPTILVHVSRMNRVLEIDEENLTATLQAYADYGQLQAEAMKKGLWNGGSPLATTLCKLSSQTAFAGIWQTDLKSTFHILETTCGANGQHRLAFIIQLNGTAVVIDYQSKLLQNQIENFIHVK